MLTIKVNIMNISNIIENKKAELKAESWGSFIYFCVQNLLPHIRSSALTLVPMPLSENPATCSGGFCIYLHPSINLWQARLGRDTLFGSNHIADYYQLVCYPNQLLDNWTDQKSRTEQTVPSYQL